jgi:hypothetical protein
MYKWRGYMFKIPSHEMWRIDKKQVSFLENVVRKKNSAVKKPTFTPMA